ncbi:hypothetical protein CC2G_013731 [Coprinopsis cinerea AmutBmut pab1-1]|nr:hypothetical protein CC2G_013731 [Coprinopsis cinerea AmutBmut pab1-1]
MPAFARIDPPSTRFVSPRDSSIEYGSSWTKVTGSTGPHRMTNTPGAQLEYTFMGSSVAWYGIIPAGSPSLPARIEWTIDRKPPNSVFISGFPETNETLTNQLFFKSPVLLDTVHSLKVVYHGNSSTVPLALDHFIYERNGIILAPTYRPSRDDPPKPLTVGQLGGIIGGSAVGAVVIFLSVMSIIRRRRARKKSLSGSYSAVRPSSPSRPASSLSRHHGRSSYTGSQGDPPPVYTPMVR